MADEDLESILTHEYNTLTRNSVPGRPAGLLDAIQLPVEALRGGAPSVPWPVDLRPILAQSSPASSINDGYTVPSPPSTQEEKTSQSSISKTIGTTALKLFTSGLGVMPLISGLAGLFGGGEATAPAPLVKYAMPRSIQIAATNSKDGGALSYADYDQDGMARSFATSSSENAPGVSNAKGSMSSSQVVVNVQAIDSRSFLDHSQEIAQAVREAMLNMHSLNDVVSEL